MNTLAHTLRLSRPSRRWIGARVPSDPGRTRVGLLGGSFNPAHQGHVHISRLARARLNLDAVWWLVSPQNPLKSPENTASLTQRVAGANAVAGHGFIKVTAFEATLGLAYSHQTVAYLTTRYAATNFVWLMGADNLIQFHQWRHWWRIAQTMPIAVLDRPGAGLRAMASRAARRMAPARWDENASACLGHATPPAWTFIHGSLCGLSSTKIREIPCE
ncbi:MAG: nicotinate-nucleotide adenylyltransferase [Alphaproteobacteria bacterium]